MLNIDFFLHFKGLPKHHLTNPVVLNLIFMLCVTGALNPNSNIGVDQGSPFYLSQIKIMYPYKVLIGD